MPQDVLRFQVVRVVAPFLSQISSQLAYDITLAVTGAITLAFLPCLLLLVTIQMQNLWKNQTTNARFGKKKNNLMT